MKVIGEINLDEFAASTWCYVKLFESQFRLIPYILSIILTKLYYDPYVKSNI
jgi:hypothetical protein